RVARTYHVLCSRHPETRRSVFLTYDYGYPGCLAPHPAALGAAPACPESGETSHLRCVWHGTDRHASSHRAASAPAHCGDGLSPAGAPHWCLRAHVRPRFALEGDGAKVRE